MKEIKHQVFKKRNQQLWYCSERLKVLLEDQKALLEDQKALWKSNYISYYDGDGNSNGHAVIEHCISL